MKRGITPLLLEAGERAGGTDAVISGFPGCPHRAPLRTQGAGDRAGVVIEPWGYRLNSTSKVVLSTVKLGP